VIAVKNGVGTIGRCLDSSLAQQAVQPEIIVIDGGSNDGTLDILRARQRELAFFLSEPDSGIYAAWNKGVAHARGEWICFLGADDEFHDSLALRDILYSSVARSRESNLIYGKINLVTRRGSVAQTVGWPWEQARSDFFNGFMIPTPALLHHRSLFEHEGFDESYRIAGDYEFTLREVIRRPAAFVDRVVVDMQLGGMSGQPDRIHEALLEIVRARSAHGLADMPPRLRLALATSALGARLYRNAGRRVFGILADAYRLVRGKPRIWTV